MVIDIGAMASKIEAAYGRAVEHILATGLLCAEADGQLGEDNRKALLARLPFDGPTFSKFVRIGSAKHLHADAVRQRLPASFSGIYLIARMDEALVAQAIKEGKLSPKARRSDIEGLSGDEVSESGEIEYGVIIVGSPLPDSNLADLESRLHELVGQYGGRFEKHLTRDEQRQENYERQLAKYLQRLDKATRSLAKRRISEYRRSHARKLPVFERKKYLRSGDDELTIEPNYTMEQIKSALAILGIEDEFELLRQRAEREVEKYFPN